MHKILRESIDLDLFYFILSKYLYRKDAMFYKSLIHK